MVQATRWQLIGGLFCTIQFLILLLGTLSAARADDSAEIAAKVDQYLAKEAAPADSKTPSAPRIDDATFLRRAFLDIVGVIPTPEEVSLFALDSNSQKRTKLVERLLADKRYGENWGRYWRDVIFYRRTEDQALLGAQSCQDYLTEQLNKNTPWDKVATAFITATGDVTENGAAGLILAQAGTPEDTVAEISRIFMGIQIQCAQCHDHPTDRWKREQFHELAAFFPRVAMRRDFQARPPVFAVAVNDREFSFRGMMPNDAQRRRGTPEHYMPDLNDPGSKGKEMQPVFFVTGQSLKTGTKDAERRESLAEWITSSKDEWFAKAFVNRLWSELVGEGFYEPVDDMGPDRQCSAPITMNYLAAEFCNHDYDVKWLFSTITRTDLYQRAAHSRRNPDDVPFQANVHQRLRADVLFNNLFTALGLQDREQPRGSSGQGARFLARTPRGQFNGTFGFDPSEHREEIVGAIPQALLMMNATILNQAIDARRGTLGMLLKTIKDDEALVVELYLRTLSREPTANEIVVCHDHIKAVSNRNEAFEDLLWSLLNSTEFLYRS